MTEDEARQNWCPFVRLGIHHDKTWDNRGNDYHHQQCIASDCMAWRWDEFINITPEADVIREGYCGLAGKP